MKPAWTYHVYTKSSSLSIHYSAERCADPIGANMSEQGQERKERYSRVRTEFDDLNTEDKVLFLMEATVSTIARGVDEFGRAVSDELNKAFSRRAEKRQRDETETGSTDSSKTASSPGPSTGSAGSKGSTGSSGTTSSDPESDGDFGSTL